MKRIINAYLAVFLVTLIGSALTLKVVDVGATNVVAAIMKGSQERLATAYAAVPKYYHP